jgi:muconate cycloisomerase
MKITGIKTTPLLVPNKVPYHWAHGVILGATVLLVEINTDNGITGYGECIATPSAEAITSYLKIAERICIGRSPFENAKLQSEIYHQLFQAHGACSAPRYAGMLLSGVEMALWDLAGKSAGLSVHALLGGKVHDEISYFGFAQGDSPDELAIHARELANDGCEVIYVKVGRGDALDYKIVKSVRKAIGKKKRLRIDPNEHWDPQTATRMINRLSVFNLDFVEQPTHCESITALAQVRAASPVAIAADQAVFTPFDTYNVCRAKAADIIVLGLHETGGISRFRQCAAIAESAGINICIHGLHETGITTCATSQAASTISNLDDGNQYMNHLLDWDIVTRPDLSLQRGKLRVMDGPGLGFELDQDAVCTAHENFLKSGQL